MDTSNGSQPQLKALLQAQGLKVLVVVLNVQQKSLQHRRGRLLIYCFYKRRRTPLSNSESLLIPEVDLEPALRPVY